MVPQTDVGVEDRSSWLSVKPLRVTTKCAAVFGSHR